MRILTILLIILKLARELNCIQVAHVDHVCSDGGSTEQAGMGSGTLTFDGSLCELTITDILELRPLYSVQVNRLNIVGVRSNGSCDSSQIVINSEIYCIDESVKDTVINVTDQKMKFAVESTQPDPFTLRYYRGEPLTCNVYFFQV